MDFQLIVLWVHIFAACTWIGGMISMTLVIVPVNRSIQDFALRNKIIKKVAFRFKYLGWGSITILILTGIFNSLHTINSLNDLIQTSYGKTLLLKTIFVLLMVLLSIIHDFYLGPKIIEMENKKNRKDLTSLLTLLSKSNLLISLFILLLAVTLRYGGVM
jgi:uncharacterized membrane protein|tara:strand:+ start:2482 stop:2961 length:480 start_codon:yes stop_codon:yes gene_type:complete